MVKREIVFSGLFSVTKHLQSVAATAIANARRAEGATGTSCVTS
jgi:hypothetical protein